MFSAILIKIAYEDQKNQKIKNKTLFLILLLSIYQIAAENVIGMLVVSIPMLFITIIRPGAFGGGDIKLMAVGGLYLGIDKIIFAIIIAIMAAAIYCIGLLTYREVSRKKVFPLGPFLCAGMMLSIIIL